MDIKEQLRELLKPRLEDAVEEALKELLEGDGDINLADATDEAIHQGLKGVDIPAKITEAVGDLVKEEGLDDAVRACLSEELSEVDSGLLARKAVSEEIEELGLREMVVAEVKLRLAALNLRAIVGELLHEELAGILAEPIVAKTTLTVDEAVGEVPTAIGDWCSRAAPSDQWVCSRPKGHAGEHIACDDRVVQERWS